MIFRINQWVENNHQHLLRSVTYSVLLMYSTRINSYKRSTYRLMDGDACQFLKVLLDKKKYEKKLLSIGYYFYRKIFFFQKIVFKLIICLYKYSYFSYKANL